VTARTVVLGRYERLCSDEVDDGVTPEPFQLPDVTRLNSARIGQVKQFRRRLITDPSGGFFLWLDVGDSAAATLHLWQAQGVRVLPGAYLTRLADTPQDPASNYIRVALVAPPEESHAAIARLVAGLEDFTNGSKPVAGGTK
jgi:alanine-alpha-ketoisovalerate/valine-pyruvate aminotransferase